MIVAFAGPGVDDRCRRWGAPGVGGDVDVRPPPGDLAAAVRAAAGEESVAGVVLPADGEALASAALAAAVGGAVAAGVGVAAVAPGNLRRDGIDPASTPLSRAGGRVVYGRGPDTARHAVEHLAHRAAWPPLTLAYGPGPDRVGDLRLPPGAGSHPVAVLLHGGFWYHAWERDLMDGAAVDLAHRGWATWNVEYRRVGAGGGWPATGRDVAAAVDHVAALAGEHGVDPGRVVLVGHSAGGQLALWAAARAAAAEAVAVRPRLVVGLAALTDLAAAAAEATGGRSVERLLAAAADPAGALADASPRGRLPLGVPQLLVHAADDDVVPAHQSGDHVAAARAAGDEAELLLLPGGGHFGLTDPASPAWAAVAERLGPGAGSLRPARW